MPSTPSPLGRLVDILQVKPEGEDRFIGQSTNIGTENLFGGQVLGQALMAACATAPAGRGIHSLHAYFLLAGKHAPVAYQAERVRDGGSFSTRRVVARQEGAEIFEMLTSFQLKVDDIDRHDPMPSIPGPEGIHSETEQYRRIMDRLPATLREKVLQSPAIEYRPVVPFDLVDGAPREARSAIWLKATEPLPDTPALHQALLAYASDHGLLFTGTLPHGFSFLSGEVSLASIDHAMWFHRDFRFDDWLLHCIDSPNLCGTRALCRGAFYNRAGQLVATTTQEGLMRVRRR